MLGNIYYEAAVSLISNNDTLTMAANSLAPIEAALYYNKKITYSTFQDIVLINAFMTGCKYQKVEIGVA
ncbi:MAG: hypothetical protein ACOYLO_00220 [Ferruginibacter sp.]